MCDLRVLPFIFFVVLVFKRPPPDRPSSSPAPYPVCGGLAADAHGASHTAGPELAGGDWRSSRSHPSYPATGGVKMGRKKEDSELSIFGEILCVFVSLLFGLVCVFRESENSHGK